MWEQATRGLSGEPLVRRPLPLKLCRASLDWTAEYLP